jgi:comEA protein
MSRLSPSEKRVLLMLSILLVAAFIIQWSQPYFVHDALYDYSVQDSLFQKLSSDTTRVKEQKTPKVKPVPQKDGNKKKSKKSALTSLININTATQKELELLPRIGPATAKNIIKYRTENGPFKTFDEIKNVKRIGPKTLEKLKPFITLSD